MTPISIGADFADAAPTARCRLRPWCITRLLLLISLVPGIAAAQSPAARTSPPTDPAQSNAVQSTAAESAALEQTKQLGPVKLTLKLTPARPTIGDELTLELRVVAAKGVEVLMPEFGDALDRYTILNFVPRQRIEPSGASVHTQRYTLQATFSGAQSIPPILVEFVDNRAGKKPAPDDLDAYELFTDRLDFEVQSVAPRGAGQALKPPLGAFEQITPGKSGSYRWLLSAIVAALIATVGGLMWWARRWRKRTLRINAYEIARRRLDALLARGPVTEPERIPEFYVDLSSIVRQYLEHRFELRAPDLTTEEFLEHAAKARDLSSDHRSLLRDFLRQADLVKFAGRSATEAEMRDSSDLAARFLEETRANAPLIASADGAPPPIDEPPQADERNCSEDSNSGAATNA